MKPPAKEFEKVSTGDFIPGVITEIKYDQAHEFTYQGNKKVNPAVKFTFVLEGYSDPKYSGWLLFSYGERTNLYKKYLISLVEGAKPFMDFDLEQLKGMKVKILFKDSEDGKFQNIDTIRPFEKKIIPDANFEADEQGVPF